MSYRYRGRYLGPDGEDEKEMEPPERFAKLIRPLIARSLGGTTDFDKHVTYPPQNENHVKLFIFAESPEGFSLATPGLGKGTGYTLYQVDLFRPEET